MDFDLVGKLNSIDVPRKKGLQPLFEAVVNGFQAIEDAKRSDRGRIDIIVDREPVLMGTDAKGRIQGFTVVDNGVGFNDENITAFFTAYSQRKMARGGKGLGRFTFLKVFDKTDIDSHFPNGNGFVSRQFALPQTEHRPTTPPGPSDASANRTSIELIGFKEPWRSACTDSLERIALDLIAHCIPYFMHPSCPKVELRDDDERVDLNDFFKKNFQHTAQVQSFVVDGHEFRMTGFRLGDQRAESKHTLLYAANHRGVVTETLTKALPSIGDHHLAGDNGKKFVYLGFVEGEYLNQHTSPERLRFNFPTGDEDDESHLPGMPTLAAIRALAVEAVKKDLAPFLRHVADQVDQRVRTFVSSKAPELRPMLRYLPQFIHEIPADVTDTKLYEILQRHYFEVQQDTRRAGRKLFDELKKQGARPADYEERLNDWIEKSNEIGKSALVRYINHRRVMLEFLEESLRVDKTTGKYKLEEVVHRIIYPMGAKSGDVPYDQQNLWIIDERLAFHWYLQSDKKLSEAIEVVSDDRPDLLVFDRAMSFSAEHGDAKKRNAAFFDTLNLPQV